MRYLWVVAVFIFLIATFLIGLKIGINHGYQTADDAWQFAGCIEFCREYEEGTCGYQDRPDIPCEEWNNKL